VQRSLIERRELLIANERLRIELADLRGRTDGTDPRLHVLEMENRALRDEVASLRREIDTLETSIDAVVEQMEKERPRTNGALRKRLA